MIVEYLSDHLGDLVEESRQKLVLLHDQKAYWSNAVLQAEHDLAAANRKRSVWRRLFNLPSPEEPELHREILEAEHGLRSVEIAITEMVAEIGTREAGAEGEKRFEGELGWMSDDWTMFRGYRNQRGEADAVLVGPDGVWTVEVKNWTGRFRIDGDTWIGRRLHDGSERRTTDRKGRSPALQVREIAESLSTRLHRVGHTVPVRTAVAVLNNNAEIESCRRPGVDFVGTSTGAFADRVAELAKPLADSEVQAIRQLVRDDHRYWERNATIT